MDKISNNSNYSNIAKKDTSNILCISCEKSYLKSEKLDQKFNNLYLLKMNIDLNQVYVADKVYGSIYPILYDILVCISCGFSILSHHKGELDLFDKSKLKDSISKRLDFIQFLFPKISLNSIWTLEHGLVFYILAFLSYKYLKSPLKFIYQSICMIRLYWISNILFNTYKNEIFNVLSNLFLSKTIKYYLYSFSLFKNGDKLKLLSNKFIGPCLYNWKIEGFLYISAYLNTLQTINSKNLDYQEKIKFFKHSLSILESVLNRIPSSVTISKSSAVLRKYTLSLMDQINKNITKLTEGK